ncbi:hypothetical protein Tco_0513688 [Tanacetum coccineum]
MENFLQNPILKVKADDQAIHILLLGLPADVYATVDSYENANAMCKRIQRYNAGQNGNQIVGKPQGNVAALMVGNYGNGQNVTQKRLMLVQQEEVKIPLTAEQHDFLVVASDEERKEGELNVNYIFMTKFKAASSNTNIAHVYDTNGLSEVPNFNNYYVNEIYSLFAHDEHVSRSYLWIPVQVRITTNIVLFDVDSGRIYIRHCKVLKSATLNVLARSDDNA